jgi:DNA-binding transcriptional ArsR family regulator
MSPAGKDAGRDRPFDPHLAKALSHPLRQRILERLSVGGEASPNQLARALDAPLGNVAYHVRILHQLGFVELVGTRQRRGALEHHYRALAHPWLDAEQWARLPASFRRLALARTLRDIVSDASEAGVGGGFDHPDAQIRRVSLELDQEGRSEVARLLDHTFTALQQIDIDSTARAGERMPGQPIIDARIAVLLFRRSPPRSTRYS